MKPVLSRVEAIVDISPLGTIPPTTLSNSRDSPAAARSDEQNGGQWLQNIEVL